MNEEAGKGRAYEPDIIWVTGAGRCGTHLLGMLGDGHPRVSAFPVELRIVEAWGSLCAEASLNGRALPAPLVDRHVASRYLVRPEVRRLLQYDPESFSKTGKQGTVSLPVYLDALHQRLYQGRDKAFLFHCPGCQLGTLLGRASEDNTQVKVVLILRHPVQNYLAWVNHSLQKGRGYGPPERVRPDMGLHSVLHLAMFRVLKAFMAASLWQEDERVLVVRLEDFTGSPEERRRVWQWLSIGFDPLLETTSRGGEALEAHSGKWRHTGVQAVTADLYSPVLAPEEASVFESCERLFRDFYPDALSGLRVGRRGTSEDLLYERERRCLRENLEALAKRRDRLSLMFRKVPKEWKELVQWPVRALYTALSDGLLYPELHLRRNRKAVRGVTRGLEGVPELAGMSLHRRDHASAAGKEA